MVFSRLWIVCEVMEVCIKTLARSTFSTSHILNAVRGQVSCCDKVVMVSPSFLFCLVCTNKCNTMTSSRTDWLKLWAVTPFLEFNTSLTVLTSPSSVAIQNRWTFLPSDVFIRHAVHLKHTEAFLDLRERFDWIVGGLDRNVFFWLKMYLMGKSVKDQAKEGLGIRLVGRGLEEFGVVGLQK